MIGMVDFNVDHGTLIDTDQVHQDIQQPKFNIIIWIKMNNSKTSSLTSETSTSTRSNSSQRSMTNIMIVTP